VTISYPSHPSFKPLFSSAIIAPRNEKSAKPINVRLQPEAARSKNSRESEC
jgi:hypothetical protein